ncbi:MAG: AAA family ATPase [Campylobacterota bacterium]|nr:AAA family ATPase [Campylobacterota bacterium]
MELVYLWVEGYKNIHKQGFNFSPRFDCSYDGKNLTIKKKEHIKDFFGENINVTAIVGENGSGKSSIMEIFSSILTLLRNKINFLYILNDGSKNIYYQHGLNYINSSIPQSTEALFNNIDIYYLNISHLERDGIIKNDAVSIEDPVKYLGVYEKNDFEKSSDNSFYPTFSEFNLSKFNFFQTFAITNLLKDIKYKKLLFETFQIEKPYSIQIDYSRENLDRIKHDNTLVPNDIRNINESVPEKINDLLTFLDDSDNKLIIERDSDLTNFFKLSQAVYNLEKEFKLTFQTKENKTIKLSAGEKTILFYLERIDYMLAKIKEDKKSTILLFDEIELYLHPMWQKRILNIILDFLKVEELESLLHIVIASHSPFILSDLPKENVIFLQNGKQVDVDINPFGANIHTLLSHGFFMQDGLMGEFAKEKIEELINYLNDKKSNIKTNDEAQKLLNIIGEPIIKNQLQRMLDSKRLSKVDKIDLIEEQIKKLQDELEAMKP